jgi:putative DNA primase/helicase
MWKAFLGRITAGDFGLQEYLKRLTGYALTGLTREHVLAFLYGTGANGKSVFINTISGVLGDYATTAPMEAFVASKTEHHPTELAMLRAARLVTATETEEGRRWAESKIKALTGGDAITARFMRQDFFTFTPQFTLIVAGNHKPGLRNVDEAMRRRLHLVPFTVTIPEDLRDDQLAEKLKVEWPGILQWMVEGAVEWGRSGLQPPKTVRTATAAYLQAEDAIAAWIEERCTTKADDFASNGALFRSWSDWATKAGEYVGKKTRLTQALEDRSFERTKATGGVRGFRGIAVKPTESDNWYDR